MKKIDFFIRQYLENRPLFFSIIRSQEAILFQKYKKLIKGKVLDFGCGDGFFAETVFGKKKIDIGLDLKTNNRTNEALKNTIYKKLVLYDGLKIPFKNNYFDTIVSNCVLEHIPNLKTSIKEIYRVLKPKGYFLTTIMTDNWEKFLLGGKLLGKQYLLWLKKKQEHKHLLSKENWEKTFKKHGLKIVVSLSYLSKKQSRLMEIFHYLSVCSLFSYKVFNKWVLFPFWYKIFFVDKIIEKILKEKNPKIGAGLFFVLKK